MEFLVSAILRTANRNPGTFVPGFSLFYDQIDKLILHDDCLDDTAALLFQETGDLLIGGRRRDDRLVVQIGGHVNGAAELSVDLHGHIDLGVLAL